MPAKSIFRQPGAKHFQLVHRSQRDPLIHDQEAGDRILKPVERKKGKTRVELEGSLQSSDYKKIGEATLYGIFYDDTEYDYMQHLRPVGVQEDGVESYLIEAPPNSGKKKGKAALSLEDLPPETIPPKFELPRNYESQEAVPSSISGFQPDMDPHLRQTLEALEDEAFIDDELQDDFFHELMANGERRVDDVFEHEFVTGKTGDDGGNGGPETENGEEGWEERFKRFKIQQQAAAAESEGDQHSEKDDTVGSLPVLSVIGGRRRRKGTSDASGFSMSSSSIYRNDAMQTLDDRFDRIMETVYLQDDSSGDESPKHSDDPTLSISRSDFGALMDDFLENCEVLGRKMHHRLEGETGAERLGALREAMGKDHHIRDQSDGDSHNNANDLSFEEDDRWDCETVLTSYSNLENHPQVIGARVTKPQPLPKSALPRTRGGSATKSREVINRTVDMSPKVTIARPPHEDNEDKKVRKQAVKAGQRARRKEKKTTKELFAAETLHQMKAKGNVEKAKTWKL